MEGAIKFVKFTADQIASLYAEFSDRMALAPSLAKIVLQAERSGKEGHFRLVKLNALYLPEIKLPQLSKFENGSDNLSQ